MAAGTGDHFFDFKHMRIIILLTFFVVLANPSWSSQESQVRQANDLFKKQQWDEAIDHYMNALDQNKNTHIVQYDLGAAFYKKGNYNQSIEHLQKALPKKDKDKKFTANTHYNLGNAFFQKGSSLEKENIDDAIKFMQESLSSYDKTLNLNAKDEDASYNRKIVEKEIERLQKKKQQQQQQSSNEKRENQSQDQQANNQPDKDQRGDQSQKSPKENKQEQPKKDEKQKNQSDNKDQDKAGNGRDHSLGDQQQKPQEGLEQRQAKAMLSDYEQNEAPKGLLNFKQPNKGEAHVDRDW